MAQDPVQVKGWPQLAQGTAVLAQHIERDTGQRFGSVAEHVAGQTRGGMPVVSGTLAGSVAVDRGPPVKVGFGSGVPYAGWIEFGGAGRPYVPGGRYFFPAVAAAEPELAAAGQDSANAEIRGMQWPKPT